MKNRKQILIVDDVTTNLRFLGEVLKDEYSLSMAKSGRQALKTLEKTIPNVILLDVKMPEMDGYETLTRIKSNEKTQDIPVIFLTADNQKENEIKGFKLGAADFIHKPFEPQDLLERVQKVLEKQEAENEIQIIANTDQASGVWNRKYLEKTIKDLNSDKANASFLLFKFDNAFNLNAELNSISEDKLLIELGKILSGLVHKDDIVARIGGFEFAVVFINAVGREVLSERVASLTQEINKSLAVFLGIEEKSLLRIGISQLPFDGNSFLELYNNADKAMYLSANSENHEYHFYDPKEQLSGTNSTIVGVSQLESLIEEDDSLSGPMVVDYGDFKDIYRFMKRYAQRTGERLQLVLFTLKDLSGKCSREDLDRSMQILESSIRATLRKNDAASKYSDSQYLVILSDLVEANRSEVIQRVTECFETTCSKSDIILKVDANDDNIDS